jgi:hypothetical protein
VVGLPKRGSEAAIFAAVLAFCVGTLAGCGSSGSSNKASAPLATTTVPTTSVAPAAAADNILTAPVRVADTADGPVGYREVGHGTPLLLIMGFGGTMDDWAPAFVDALSSSRTPAHSSPGSNSFWGDLPAV